MAITGSSLFQGMGVGMVQAQAAIQSSTATGAERASLVYPVISARGRLLPVHPETRRAIHEIGRKGGSVGVVLPGGLRIKTRTVGPATVCLAHFGVVCKALALFDLCKGLMKRNLEVLQSGSIVK